MKKNIGLAVCLMAAFLGGTVFQSFGMESAQETEGAMRKGGRLPGQEMGGAYLGPNAQRPTGPDIVVKNNTGGKIFIEYYSGTPGTYYGPQRALRGNKIREELDNDKSIHLGRANTISDLV